MRSLKYIPRTVSFKQMFTAKCGGQTIRLKTIWKNMDMISYYAPTIIIRWGMKINFSSFHMLPTISINDKPPTTEPCLKVYCYASLWSIPVIYKRFYYLKGSSYQTKTHFLSWSNLPLTVNIEISFTPLWHNYFASVMFPLRANHSIPFCLIIINKTSLLKLFITHFQFI